jgi:ribonuclease HI
MKLRAFIDGSSLGNPGESGCGIVLEDQDGTVVEKRGIYLGHATNNVAEYEGLIRCLESAKRHGAVSLEVFSDSQLLVNQVNGTYRIKQPHLIRLYDRIQDLLESGGFTFHIRHIPREQNRDADGLARGAIRARSRAV